MTENNQLFRIITLGDSGVGKSSIIMRYTNGSFDEKILSTVGLEFTFKEVTLKDGLKIKLKFIDTAGQEKYRSLAKSYFKNAEGVLFIFSYDKKKSFDHIEEWFKSFNEQCPDKDNIPKILIGNKCDLENKEINDNLVEDLKKRIGIENFSITSAKNNIGIEKLFTDLAEKMYEQNKKYIGKKQQNKQLENNELNEKKKKKLCSGCTGPI